MLFEKIDINTWARKEYFKHYLANIPCTYSMTVKLDITKIRKQQIKLYPAMLYYITTIVNRHSEFRTAFNENNELGVYSDMIPLLYGISQRHRNLLQPLDSLYVKL